MSGAYITLTYGTGGVHFRPDARRPVAACGLNFTGQYATTHPVVTGEAFDCGTCREAWKQAEREMRP